MSKIIAVVLASIVGFFNSISFIPHIPKPSPSPVAIVSPAPTQPSERALKVAAYALESMSSSNKQEIKKKYGGVGVNDTETIRAWAFAMDKDPALLAKNEAVMQKDIQVNSQKGQYYYPSTSTSQVSDPVIFNNDSTNSNLQKIENCQKETQTYNECVQAYNEKMADYSQCLTEASDPTSLRAQGYGRYASMSCYKPFNSCMKPISCY